jgi:hypothetical protein
MPQKINTILNVQIAGGPKLSSSQNVEVDAYDQIEVVVPHGGADLTVDIQPSAADHVKFLLISADRYDGSLTYKPKDEGGTGTKAVKLDAQQVLSGAGAIGLLEKAPKQLVFKNADAVKDAKVQILVGRNV